MSKKILIVSRYFWPDKSPESTILFSLARCLVSEGYMVDVLSSYPYKSKKFEELTKRETYLKKRLKIID